MKIVGMLLLVVVLVAGVWYWAHHSSEAALTNGEVKETGTGETVKIDPNTHSETQVASQTPLDIQSGASGTAMPLQLTGQTAMQPATVPSTGYVTPPASDSIERNPPNGMVFAGTGRYQVYRQGDLTWRLNTESGQACIIFATDSEWRKPRVYRNGCNGKG